MEDLSSSMAALKAEAGQTVEAKQVELASARRDGEALKSRLEETEGRLKASNDEREATDRKICELQRAREKEKADMEERLGDLGKAKEMLLNAKVELQGKLEGAERNFQTASKEALRRQEENAAKLSEAAAEEERLKREMTQQSDSHRSALSAKEAESGRLRSEAAEAEGGRTRAEAKLNEATLEMNSALSAKLELEAKLGSIADERKALLERCLAAESELDRTRSTTVEMRRKLDDSQAALHELGRENQSIQMELLKQTGRKWADDADASNCSSCGGQFTITNRKHHCRNCGQIFCADCSGRSAPMANYKKPQRVCDPCHSELQQ